MDIEDLKKDFIVDAKEFETEDIVESVKLILKYCKIDSNGNIHLMNHDLTQSEKISIALTARFLANKIQNSIDSKVSVEELSAALNMEPNTVSARLTELTQGKVVNRIEEGTYAIASFHIKRFFKELVIKYDKSNLESGTHSTESTKFRKNKKIEKGSNVETKPKIETDFIKNIVEKIEKSKHVYINKLQSVSLKSLAILKVIKQDFNIDGLTSAQILYILNERFRINVAWSSISNVLKELDSKGLIDSVHKEGSSGRTYRILNEGEELIKLEIEKLSTLKEN